MQHKLFPQTLFCVLWHIRPQKEYCSAHPSPFFVGSFVHSVTLLWNWHSKDRLLESQAAKNTWVLNVLPVRPILDTEMNRCGGRSQPSLGQCAHMLGFSTKKFIIGWFHIHQAVVQPCAMDNPWRVAYIHSLNDSFVMTKWLLVKSGKDGAMNFGYDQRNVLWIRWSMISISSEQKCTFWWLSPSKGDHINQNLPHIQSHWPWLFCLLVIDKIIVIYAEAI